MSNNYTQLGYVKKDFLTYSLYSHFNYRTHAQVLSSSCQSEGRDFQSPRVRDDRKGYTKRGTKCSGVGKRSRGFRKTTETALHQLSQPTRICNPIIAVLGWSTFFVISERSQISCEGIRR